MKPEALAIKTQRSLDAVKDELARLTLAVAEVKEQVTLTLGLVAAIAEAVSPAVKTAVQGLGEGSTAVEAEPAPKRKTKAN